MNYTIAEHNYLKENARTKTIRELASELDRYENSVRSYVHRHGFKKSSRKKTGGKKAMPNGTITVTNNNGKPTKMIKINGKWKRLHQHIMSEHYGKNLTGRRIIFKDGDRMNCDIENLEVR